MAASNATAYFSERLKSTLSIRVRTSVSSPWPQAATKASPHVAAVARKLDRASSLMAAFSLPRSELSVDWYPRSREMNKASVKTSGHPVSFEYGAFDKMQSMTLWSE
jgi:hypothetical protein